jgi:exosortase E/protease (VPEID-CTERM system)
VSLTVSLAVTPPVAASRRRLARTIAWLALCVGEALFISWLFELPYWFRDTINPFTVVRQTAVWALMTAAAFAVLAWPQRQQLLASWQAEQSGHSWPSALAVNAVVFAVLAVATAALTRYAAGLDAPPRLLLVGYTLLLAACAVSMLRIDVPFAGAVRVVRAFRTEIAVAAAVGLGVQLLGMLSAYGWEPMAAATLEVTKFILELYESDVAIYPDERMIRIGNFAAVITRNCSGYEGIALVTAFLAVYLWVFRSTLRFPRALVLFPIGIVTIWLLNCVRIALLTSLGAHVSPEMAVKGFHSQAGWIAFLAATLAIMALAQGTGIFASARPGTNRDAAPLGKSGTSDLALLAHLAPFMALMLAAMTLSAVAPHDRPLYALKVVAVGLALWFYRDIYRSWPWNVSGEAVLAGLVVAVAWIATDPAPPEASELAVWLERIGPTLAAVWIVLRVIGASITVPIAEELAFRGLLHRWLIARDFESVPYARFTPLAFAVSTLLFGLMHERWLAGMLAGAVFAFVMYRTRSIAGPVVAHMTANAAICAWALVWRQWSLL